MKTYHKTFTVHNTLITYDVWERHQAIGWKERFGAGTTPALFDVRSGVAQVYYHGVFGTFRKIMQREQGKDARFFHRMMDQYEAQLTSIQAILAEGQLLPDIPALVAFAKQFQDAWIGLDMSYMPDYVALDTAAERRSAKVREQAFGFYIGADQLIRQSLEKLLPDLGTLSQYVTLNELTANRIPKQRALEARAEHYIYFQGQVHTNISLEAFCKRESIRIESVYAPLRKEIHGFAAIEGKVVGSAHILRSNESSSSIQKRSILVADDLTPRDIPLAKQASSLILDNGSYYGLGAILARALKKPCIFGTNISTLVLQIGDELSVDGSTGMVCLKD